MTKRNLVVVLAAAGLTLTACGSDGAGTESSSRTTTAAETSTSTSTSSASSTSQDGSAEAEPLDPADVGVGDEVDAVRLGTTMLAVFADGQSGHVVMEMGSGAGGEGDFEVVDGRQNRHVTMEIAGLTVESIQIGDTTYTKSTMFGDGKKWFKTSTTAPGVPDTSAIDPVKISRAFAGQTARVTAKDGDVVTYLMELDLRKLMTAMESDLPTTGLPTSVPVSYTLDGEGRPMKSTVDVGATPITVVYSDWGKDVDITAPPSSEVTTR